MSTVEDGAKTFWQMSQKYHSLESAERQVWYINTVVKPMTEHIKNHWAKQFLTRFINQVESDRLSIRPTLGSG